MTKEELKIYGAKIRQENRRRRIKELIIVFLVMFIGFCTYKRCIGEYIPFIYKTKKVKATIVSVDRSHWGRGVYKYISTYHFNHEGNDYYGTYDLWKNIDKAGDLILVEFAVSNPSLNEVK